ncbi:MAG TPA: FAD-dependent oxidoreductase, partial [Jatrophihabitans sp.]|nr:FAD-dependent oxidoreductase [Jatrophihabitans sp.]
MTGSVVIVGAGQAGAVAARTLRRKGFSGAVHLVGAEPHLPYQRPPLSKEYLAEGDDDGLFLLDEARCAKLELDLHLGVRAERIRPAAGAVELADGTSLRADAVVLATGGRPRRLPGVEGERVHHLRTVEDADRLRAALQPGARIVVIGAGFIGSEVASAARARGAEVTVIEALAAPLLRVVGARVGAACAELAARAGVSVRLGESVTSVEEGAGEVV